MTWIDDGCKFKIQVSTAGDFVKLGTATTYPFVSGGGGIPEGWTQYLAGGAVAGDVSWTTSYERFSIGNIGTDVHHAKYYGIYRDFNINTGKYWLAQVQCRTTDGRSTAIRYVQWKAPAGTGFTYQSQVWSYPDWEQVSLYTSYVGYNTMRVQLVAAPYTAVDANNHPPADANWGIQFTNFTLVEMESDPPAPTWKDITCDIHAMSVHHGRDKFLNRYDVASCGLDILNDDGEFTYGLAEWLRPGRFINIGCIPPGSNPASPLPFFYGIIDNIQNGFTLDGRAVVSFACIDVSSLLSNIEVPTYSDQFETYVSWQRFRNLALSAGWHPQMISSLSGTYIQQAILANGRSVRDELGLIADSEGGAFYADRTGRLVFKARTWETSDPKVTTVQAELLATPTNVYLPPVDLIPTVPTPAVLELRSIATEWSRDRIINQTSIANQGGTALVTNDFDSQRDYGPRTYQRLDLLNANSHPEYLTERTNDIMAGYTDAILRVNSVEFKPSTADYKFCAELFLNWLVRTRYEHPTEGWGFAVVSHVQGITHSLTTHGWSMVLALDKPEAFTYYTTSATGWDIGLWDVALWDEFGDEGAYWNSGELWNDPNTKWGP